MTEVAKTQLEQDRENLEAKAVEANKNRTGKGTRVKVGSTRGKNPQAISFENFDESLPDTLPKTLSEFMGLFPNVGEPEIVSYIVDGFNLAMYTAASDPIAEYVDLSWDMEVQKQFRLVVRNYSNATGVSIEDAVALIKPGIESAASAARAKADAEKTKTETSQA